MPTAQPVHRRSGAGGADRPEESTTQAAEQPQPEPALRLRITHILTSMAPPLQSLRSLYVPHSLPSAIPIGLIPHQLPVIRVFGTTPSHQKICANIHLAYPYFYVPFPMDSLNPLRPERVVGLCQRFAVSLNHAICLALRQNPTGPSTSTNYAGGTDPKHLHVISVMLVKGIPFYGYHVGYSYFLKVTLVNPSRVRIATEQLRKPVVLGREWQPHEAHLSHVLQFMCDFDLYGCGTLDISGGLFREPLPDRKVSDTPLGGMITYLSAAPDMRYPSGMSPPRDTYTELEVDILPHQIMNRNRLTERPLHHDFIELLYQPLNPEDKLVPAMKELWEDERRRRASKGLGTSEREMLPISGGGRGRSMEELGYKSEGQEINNRGGDWKISDELWEMIEARMVAERARRGRVTFDHFAGDLRNGKNGEKRKYDRWVMTTFEAVSAHWPKMHRTQQSQQQPMYFSSPGSPQKLSSQSVANPFQPLDPPLDTENPFDLAASQASQGESFRAEVNAQAIHLAADGEEDDDDDELKQERQHEAAARLHAKEGELLRATQRAPDVQFDDDNVDHLVRPAVSSQDSSHFAVSASRDPSFSPNAMPRSTMSDRRRKGQLQDQVEKAGFGDLSDILEMSSVVLSSPAGNPYAAPQTPTKKGSQAASETSTPLVRNIFSRPRGSSTETPHSTPARMPRPNTVVLPTAQRSVGRWSFATVDSSPDQPPSPTPRTTKKNVPLEIHVKTEISPVPNAQQTPATPVPLKRDLNSALLLSPTIYNSPQRAPRHEPMTAVSSQIRPKKKVRLSSPVRSPIADSNSSVRNSGHVHPKGLPVNGWMFVRAPPSLTHVIETMSEFGLDTVVYDEPFYSDPTDVPSKPKLFAGRAFRVKTSNVDSLPEFEHFLPQQRPWLKTRQDRGIRATYGWEYIAPPPSLRDVSRYCETEDATVAKAISQLAGPTQANRYGFKLSPKKPQREQRNMSVLLLEVFAPSRLQLLPDPEKDEIAGVFFCFQNDRDDLVDTTRHEGCHAGYVVIDNPQVDPRRASLDGVPCHRVESELDLINWIIDMVKDWDPDVLAGWELQNASWGYIASRAHHIFGTSLMQDLSRLVTPEGPQRKDAYSEHHTSLFKVAGRHVLNIWRILRGEVTLNAYTFENVVFHVLHQRIPHYTAPVLTALWKSKTPEHTARVLKIMFQRVVLYAELIDAAEIITKNTEFARVFGVDFDAVIFRGSQFKVESFMFRIAKPESFVLVTPSKQQVGLQNAPFAVPLIAEPESKYYPHPIVVLDFQSLYPSVMIAYNICFSTCLGRVEKFKGTDKFGFTELKVAEGLLELLKDYLTVTPNGMIFVKPAVRKSLLAKMLGEILDTRVMVKNAMKHVRGDKSLTQLLNARQLGLKLMANVTYGYTSATYSGRMPCIEIADSIVQTGRETLEKAQELIHSREDWGATVVYGDTDSLFISLPGRSKEQAFKIGHDIAEAVTAMNPKPVKLKFEKVYMGSVLMAKKRYVGFKYEHPDDEPVFDAKGIETIRRDGFPAQQKIEEVCLKLLFRTQDLSQIKAFCVQEWTKILQGRVSLQDFIVAKEVRLGTYSEKGVPPPGAAVAYRRILKDPRDEPQYAERVPYIISNSQGRRLIDRARMPEEMLANPTIGIDAEYYICNLLVPPLSRIFNLVGADVEAWFENMPRAKRAGKYAGVIGSRIDAHFRSTHCVVCGDSMDAAGRYGKICPECKAHPDATTHTLLAREQLATSRLLDLQRICASCSGTPITEPVLCKSIDCPTTYARVTAENDATELADVPDIIARLEW